MTFSTRCLRWTIVVLFAVWLGCTPFMVWDYVVFKAENTSWLMHINAVIVLVGAYGYFAFMFWVTRTLKQREAETLEEE